MNKIIVSPLDGGYWYCHIKDDNLVYDSEFDSMVHIECIKQALRIDLRIKKLNFLNIY